MLSVKLHVYLHIYLCPSVPWSVTTNTTPQRDPGHFRTKLVFDCILHCCIAARRQTQKDRGSNPSKVLHPTLRKQTRSTSGWSSTTTIINFKFISTCISSSANLNVLKPLNTKAYRKASFLYLLLNASLICIGSTSETWDPWWCRRESQPRWGWRGPWTERINQSINQMTRNQLINEPEDRKSREKTHGASNHAKLSLQGQFSISFNLIVAGGDEVNLDQL